VWARVRNRGGLEVTSIKVQLKKTREVVRRKQYPILMEERIGLKPVIEGLIRDGLLEPVPLPSIPQYSQSKIQMGTTGYLKTLEPSIK
jgi:hypothetical protein